MAKSQDFPLDSSAEIDLRLVAEAEEGEREYRSASPYRNPVMVVVPDWAATD